jgi:hypothetical protein
VLDANLTADFRPRLGIRVDVGYARAPNLYNSGHPEDVLNYFAGPVLYPLRNRRYGLYVDALIGGARVTGRIPTTNGYLGRGMANKLGWAVGGGWERKFDRSSSIRIGAEYMHTVFFNSSLSTAGQSSVRLTVSAVHHFGVAKR